MSEENRESQPAEVPRASKLATATCALGLATLLFQADFFHGDRLRLSRAFMEVLCILTIVLGLVALVRIRISRGARTGIVRGWVGMFMAALTIFQMTMGGLGPHTEHRLTMRSRDNLRRIAVSVCIWTNEKGGTRLYPRTLKALVEDGIVTDTRIFIHPKSDRTGFDAYDPARPDRREFAPDYDSLMDRAGFQIHDEDASPDLMMVWEKEALFSFGDGPGRNVAFTDSHVRLVSETEFKKLLAEVDKWIAEHRPKEPQPATSN